VGEIVSLRTKSDRRNRLNVLGQPLAVCSCEPLTGWLRDGTCATDEHDYGHHVICCVITKDFLKFSLECGNDLSTPQPQYGFPGLKPGDRWCLCALRWREAYEAGKAPLVVLEATHYSALSVIPLEALKRNSSPMKEQNTHHPKESSNDHAHP